MNRRLCSDCKFWRKDIEEDNDELSEDWGSCEYSEMFKKLNSMDRDGNIHQELNQFATHRNFGCVNWFWKPISNTKEDYIRS